MDSLTEEIMENARNIDDAGDVVSIETLAMNCIIEWRKDEGLSLYADLTAEEIAEYNGIVKELKESDLSSTTLLYYFK